MTSALPARSRAQISLAAFWLALSPAVAIGFGRFAYALVLPAMKTDLGWTYRQAGLLTTANAVGYLAGAMLAAPVLRRIATRTALLCGLAAAVLALILAGATRDYTVLLVARALVGTAAAFTFIAATTLAAHLGTTENENALALGISISGPGFGVVATGALVPFVLNGDAAHWPRAWWVMGAIGLVLLPLIAWNTRAHAASHLASRDVTPSFRLRELRPLGLIIVAYFLFGTGYIAYMTFLVAYVRGLQGSAATVATVWALMGGAMVCSSLFWKNIVARNSGGQAMAFMGLGGAAAALLPLLSSSLPVLVVSAVGFGLATMPVFTTVAMLIRRHLPRALWSGAIVWSTVIFACGQSLGPFASGALSDTFGLSASLWWTAILLSIGAFIALRHAPITQSTVEFDRTQGDT
jgi:predicted MFS family arabinose efflux permease